MPKNYKIIDHKPKNEAVVDVKPKNEVTDQFSDQVYEVILSAGSPIGLLLTLTYPNTGTVLSSKSP